MAKNLFVCTLDDVSFEDIDTFLGLRLALERRPREGVRCDWKEDAPAKLGETVAAFANTVGGLIFIGVEEGDGEQKGLPISATGVDRSQGELKTRLAQMVTASVSPIPNFSIGTVALPSHPERDVAVIRVEQGDWPPYVWTKGGANKIAVRHEDICEAASPLELESLLQRRLASGPVGEIDWNIYGPAPDELIDDEHGNRPGTFLSIKVLPLHSRGLHLDRTSEKAAQEAIEAVFRLPGATALVSRDHRSTVWRARRTIEGPPRVVTDERFAIHRDGCFGFATHALAPGGIFVGNLIEDSLQALLAAHAINQIVGAGRVAICYEVSLGTAALLDRSFEDEDRVRLTGLDGVAEASRMPSHRYEATVDSSSLQQSRELIADALLETLRAQRSVDIDYERLLRAVDGVAVRLAEKIARAQSAGR